MHQIKWSEVLDAFEKRNPRGFDYFYHFHSMYDLPEYDLSPFERLEQIAEYSSEADQIRGELEEAAFSCIPSSLGGTAEFGEEGIIVFPA
jgi:hypothetical protein